MVIKVFGVVHTALFPKVESPLTLQEIRLRRAPKSKYYSIVPGVKNLVAELRHERIQRVGLEGKSTRLPEHRFDSSKRYFLALEKHLQRQKIHFEYLENELSDRLLSAVANQLETFHEMGPWLTTKKDFKETVEGLGILAGEGLDFSLMLQELLKTIGKEAYGWRNRTSFNELVQALRVERTIRMHEKARCLGFDGIVFGQKHAAHTQQVGDAEVHFVDVPVGDERVHKTFFEYLAHREKEAREEIDVYNNPRIQRIVRKIVAAAENYERRTKGRQEVP